MKQEYKELIERAFKARENSYSPYSHYRVGACALTDKGMFGGCNIENAAYGPSNCAERTAIFSAIANGAKKIYAIAIIGSSGDEFAFPCGICLQVMVEFNPDMKIIVADQKKEYDIYKLSDLLPHSFGPHNLV